MGLNFGKFAISLGILESDLEKEKTSCNYYSFLPEEDVALVWFGKLDFLGCWDNKLFGYTLGISKGRYGERNTWMSHLDAPTLCAKV